MGAQVHGGGGKGNHEVINSYEGDHSSLETQGQIVGTRESLNGRRKKSAKKSLERGEEPLWTNSHRTSSKRLASFWLLIGARKSLYFSAQSQGSWLGVRFACSNTEGYTK